jgi:hypothetical protein
VGAAHQVCSSYRHPPPEGVGVVFPALDTIHRIRASPVVYTEAKESGCERTASTITGSHLGQPTRGQTRRRRKKDKKKHVLCASARRLGRPAVCGQVGGCVQGRNRHRVTRRCTDQPCSDPPKPQSVSVRARIALGRWSASSATAIFAAMVARRRREITASSSPSSCSAHSRWGKRAFSSQASYGIQRGVAGWWGLSTLAEEVSKKKKKRGGRRNGVGADRPITPGATWVTVPPQL